MSKQDMVETVLATELSEAVAKDEKEGSSDIAKNIFGQHTSKYIKELATLLCEHTTVK